MDIQNSIQTLQEELNQHNYNYYALDTPTISDFEFDIKLKQLQELENKLDLLFTRLDTIEFLLRTKNIATPNNNVGKPRP